MFRWFARRDRGFTMIEMMVVLIIIAVLIGVGIKFYTGYIENSKITKAKSQITVMQAALDSYFAENGAYPANKDQLLDAGIKASDANTLETKDPWGQYYKYNFTSESGGPQGYSVFTGYDNVQGTKGRYVVGKGRKGASESPTISTDTNAPTTP